jgi:hypothetical protein
VTDEQGNTVTGWEPAKEVDTSAEGEVYRIEYKCYYKYCSKYTGKLFTELKIGEKDHDEKEDTDDSEELKEMIENDHE